MFPIWRCVLRCAPWIVCRIRLNRILLDEGPGAGAGRHFAHPRSSLHDGLVTFRWKDYARGSQPAIMTLQATEFIRRFLLHVPPKSFVRIRHFGFLANGCRQQRLQLCRELLDIETTTNLESSNPRDDSLTKEKEPKPPDRCPVCKVGCLRPLEILLPQESTISGSHVRLMVAIPETDTS
jgi:hypothetical protein